MSGAGKKLLVGSHLLDELDPPPPAVGWGPPQERPWLRHVVPAADLPPQQPEHCGRVGANKTVGSNRDVAPWALPLVRRAWVAPCLGQWKLWHAGEERQNEGGPRDITRAGPLAAGASSQAAPPDDSAHITTSIIPRFSSTLCFHPSYFPLYSKPSNYSAVRSRAVCMPCGWKVHRR